MENNNITHKNPMHLNVKYQQWKYPINVICTTFPCVGFVGLKWEIVYFLYQLPFMGFCKISLWLKGVTLKKPHLQGYSEQINMVFGAGVHIWLILG